MVWMAEVGVLEYRDLASQGQSQLKPGCQVSKKSMSHLAEEKCNCKVKSFCF
jgi:hypothetical protein